MHLQGKRQPAEHNSKITQMLELADKVIKAAITTTIKRREIERTF